MEIVFQNKREDIEAFYAYMATQTKEGKSLGRRAFISRQVWTFLIVALIGSLFQESGDGGFSWYLALFLFLAVNLMFFLLTSFKPLVYSAKDVYRQQSRSLTTKDLQVFSLPKTLTADDNWLEIRSSETVHRWHWRVVNHIGLTVSFIFIHVGNCPVVYVPKRAFSSDDSYLEFGKQLIQFREKYMKQPIGEE